MSPAKDLDPSLTSLLYRFTTDFTAV